MTYNDLDSWKSAVKESGGSVKKITVSKDNTYYQAIDKGEIIGFFNDWKSKPAFGRLDVKACND